MFASEETYLQGLHNLEREICRWEKHKAEAFKNIGILKQTREELRTQYALVRLKNRPDASAWTSQPFPWSEKVCNTLQQIFRFDYFRPNQLAAINAALSNKDVLLTMPPGGGKSLVFQLISVITGNISIVICPLISLIDDHLMALKKLAIPAATLNSTSSKKEKKEVISKMLIEGFNIIFVTPDSITNIKTFMNTLLHLQREGRLIRFIIDEVHCCSQWSFDPRTEYRSLSILKREFPRVPILGLTATATPHDIVDIQKLLQIPESVVITGSYNRANLFYQVVHKPDEKSESVDYVETLMRDTYKAQIGIIYTRTQEECEDLVIELRNRGLKVAPYHENLENHIRTGNHKNWAEGTIQAIIATTAFGMGISKLDVRFVIHYTIPKSIEAFYQQSGRAGHDEQKADCLLMFNLSDCLTIFTTAPNKKQEKSITDVLTYSIHFAKCRRETILRYFVDNWKTTDCKKMCDYCSYPLQSVKIYDISSCLGNIVEIINVASINQLDLTLKQLLDFWFHTGPNTLQLSVVKPSFTRMQGEYIIACLFAKNFLIAKRSCSLATNMTFIGVNLEEVFNVKQFGGSIAMEYAGIIPSIPIYTEAVPTNENVPGVSSCQLTTANMANKSQPDCTIIDLTGSDNESSSSASECISNSFNSNQLESPNSTSSENCTNGIPDPNENNSNRPRSPVLMNLDTFYTGEVISTSNQTGYNQPGNPVSLFDNTYSAKHTTNPNEIDYSQLDISTPIPAEPHIREYIPNFTETNYSQPESSMSSLANPYTPGHIVCPNVTNCNQSGCPFSVVANTYAMQYVVNPNETSGNQTEPPVSLPTETYNETGDNQSKNLPSTSTNIYNFNYTVNPNEINCNQFQTPICADTCPNETGGNQFMIPEYTPTNIYNTEYVTNPNETDCNRFENTVSTPADTGIPETGYNHSDNSKPLPAHTNANNNDGNQNKKPVSTTPDSYTVNSNETNCNESESRLPISADISTNDTGYKRRSSPVPDTGPLAQNEGKGKKIRKKKAEN